MKKLKSSAIYYALFLSIIISLFLGGMILFSSANRQFISQMDMQDRLIENAYSGVEYGLANYQEMQNGKVLELDLFDQQIDSVDLKKKTWGAFTAIESTAHHKNQSYSKLALAGQINTDNGPNLYLTDQGRPFSICGETKIEGKCVIPKAGVKRAYIEGKNYAGKQMIYGSISDAEKSLPKINNEFTRNLNEFDAEIVDWEDTDSVVVSFSEIGKHFIAGSYLSLKDVFVEGQVIIEAKDSIFVSASTHLDKVILKSEVIYIESGFVGNAQFFASERIVLEDQVLLNYPSVLGLIETTIPKEQSAEILIGEKSQVLGSVFAISEAPNFRMPIQISIDRDAEVDGLVYCQGRIQLKGTVNGNLYTQKFYLETPSSKYENHLLDAKILDQLPADFVSVSLFENTNTLTQIAWLD